MFDQLNCSNNIGQWQDHSVRSTLEGEAEGYLCFRRLMAAQAVAAVEVPAVARCIAPVVGRTSVVAVESMRRRDLGLLIPQ
jgi:hypothetical protein